MASTVDQIAIKLGIQTGDLKAALADAGADIKKFKKTGESTEDEGLLGQFKNIKKSIHEFRNLLVAGGIASAVTGFFKLAIDAAKESKDATDENARAVRDFGKAAADSHGLVASTAILVVGTFNRLGEAIGDVAIIARTGWSEWAKQQDQVAATAAAASIAEQRYAEIKKQNGAEFEKLNKELIASEKELAATKEKGLDVFDRQRKIGLEVAVIAQQLREFEGSTIERRRIQVELAERLVDQEKANQDAKKETAKIEEEAAKAAEKAEEKVTKDREEAWKKHVQVQERIQELRHDALPIEKRIAELEESRATVAAKIADAKKTGTAHDDEDVALLEINNELEKERAALAKETADAQKLVTDEIEKQAKAVKKQADAYADLMQNKYIKTKGDVTTLSEVQLEALLQKLRRDLAPIKAADAMQGGVGIGIGSFRSIEQLMGETNIAAIEKELRDRREVGRAIDFFGEDKASTMFAPDEFSRLAALLNPDQAKKQAADIAGLASTIFRVFPKQAQNIRP